VKVPISFCGNVKSSTKTKKTQTEIRGTGFQTWEKILLEVIERPQGLALVHKTTKRLQQSENATRTGKMGAMTSCGTPP
jgi:hypothetical protein